MGMNDDTIQKIIEQTTSDIVIKLKKANMLKDKNPSAFKKTENALKEYAKIMSYDHEDDSQSQRFCRIMNNALDSVRNDEYFGIIEMIYFENRTRESIAEFYGVEPITITRNKKRLINKLKEIIYSDEVIKELFL